MRRLGFIHDMMDVKVLILFVTARVQYPVSCQEIYELCYQDECLSYFDVCTAIPELVQSGHLQEVENEKLEITPKGRETVDLTEDSLAYTVRQRAENAVARFNRQVRRSSLVQTKVTPKESGEFSVIMTLRDGISELMTLELAAPNQKQAIHLSRQMEQKAETVYSLVMMELLDDMEE